MGELTGGLIQMNAHMVRQSKYDVVIALGIVAAIIFVMLAAFTVKDSKKAFAAWLVLAIVGAVVAIIAYNKPMVKEIHACASGPISLESVASVYDIVEIDGKELVLRER